MKNWITKKLGDCSIKFVDGDRSSRYPKRDEFVASGIPFLNAESINSGYVNLDKANFIAENKFSEIKKGRLEQNDLILTTRGNGVGKVAYFLNDKVETGLINAQLLIVRTFGDLNAKYLYYYFSSCFFQGNIKNFVSGAAQPQIPISSLKSIEISYPLPKAQQKIADILSNYDDLIENNRRRIQLLERSLHLLYKEWFVHLRFPSHEHSKIVDGIPEGWQTGTVADFYRTSSGGTPSRKRPEFFTGEINWVKTQELNEGFIFSSDEKITEEAVKCSSAKVFPEETVLVAMYGATIGQTAILGVPAATNQACCSIIPNHPNAHYIHAFLFFRENKQGLMNLSQGSAQNNISQEIIKTYPMVLPTEMLMSQFVDYSKPVFRQIKNLSLQNRQLKQARDLLLPKLMSGAIGV